MHQMSEEKSPELKNKSLESEFSINQQILLSKMEEIMWRIIKKTRMCCLEELTGITSSKQTEWLREFGSQPEQRKMRQCV